MSRKRGLTALLGAFTAAGLAVSSTTAVTQPEPFYGLVAQLGVSCMVPNAAGGYALATTPAEIAVCCAVFPAIGPENIDFLQAVASGNRADPRLITLDEALVEVLLGCSDQAVARLEELALAGPAPLPGVAP